MTVVFDSTDRVLAVVHLEEPYTDYCEIILDNSDEYFSDRVLEGAKITLSFGYTV